MIFLRISRYIFKLSEMENIDLAYSELILRQQQKLAELKTKIRQKIESFYEICEKRRMNYFESVSFISLIFISFNYITKRNLKSKNYFAQKYLNQKGTILKEPNGK